MAPPVFRPSMVCNIRLVFDEALTVDTFPTPVTTDDMVRNPPRSTGSSGLQPLLVRAGVENTSFILGRVPLDASLSLPGYRQAGEFSCSFAFSDLPIDPRTVRAAAIEVHLGTISDDDFRAGMSGVESNGRRRSQLQTRTADDKPNPDTLKMLVMVDEWDVKHDGASSKVSMKGRDPRGILIDTPISVLPKASKKLLDSLDLTQPITKVVTQILAFNPFFEQFPVHSDESDWPDGVLPVMDENIVPRHRKGAKAKIKGGRGNPPTASIDTSFWDMIVRFCFAVGAIPFFKGNELHIRPTRSLYQQQNTNNATPFKGGAPRSTDVQSRTPLEKPLRSRRLVYGRDVESLSFDRKFAGFHRPKTIRVVSVDNSSTQRGVERTLVGVWPPHSDKPSKKTKIAAGGKASAEECLTYTYPGIRDIKRLTIIAQALFEEIGRQEMGGSCSTANLASFGGDNTDPDLLRLQPGDAVEFVVDVRNAGARVPLVSPYVDSQRTGFEEQVALINARLNDENLARVIVATTRGQVQGLQRTFRTKNIKYAWKDSGTALSISFDFENYVEVRNAVDYSAPELADNRLTMVPGRATAARRRVRGRVPSSVTIEEPSITTIEESSITIIEEPTITFL